jgi:hypothetical protein
MLIARCAGLCFFTAAVLSALLLGGCGGGGERRSELLSGTAVVDAAPLVRADVRIRCVDGSVFNSITNDSGVWQVVISTQPLPCALQASGGTWQGSANATAYHAIALSFGVTDITPLSNLVLARLTGQDPQTWFAGPAFAGVNAGTLGIALATVSAALGMGPAISQFNPLTAVDVSRPLVQFLYAMRLTRDDPGVHKTDAELLEAARSGDFSGFAAFAATFPGVYAMLLAN